jgi:hypothetical protein
MPKFSKPFCTLGLALCVFAAGCEATPAVNKDRKTTFLDSNDMVTMTNQMARSIIADPRVQSAAASGGPLKIVIKPVTNLTNEIIPAGQGELFVARLQGLLAKEQALSDRFQWVINRTDYEKLRAEEIPESQLGPSETRITPEYALWAEFHSVTDAKKNTRNDLYLCTYKLTKISSGLEGATIWTGEYQTSKTIKRSMLD